ncbi:MAG TPA: ankyrin repeat domain-containing protein [Rhizomicrobium sp.]|nr:ankyrin repeat domain-containing protein [Rhizomicrobium sp.]
MLLASGAQAAAVSPDIADWSKLKITLRRGGCYDCEAYRFEISGDGSVEYEGYSTVAVRGLHRFRIPESAVRDLVTALWRANVFDVPEDNLRRKPGAVHAVVSDAFTANIRISFDGRSKEITDYAGLENPTFESARRPVALINDAAGMSSWVDGDAMTLLKLEREGWDFRIPADKHSMLFVSAAEMGNSALVRQLLDKGVAVRNVFGCAALRTAAEGDDLKTAALLVDAQVPVSAPEFDRHDRYLPSCTPLNTAAQRGNAEMIKLILRLRPDIDQRGFKGKTPLIEAAENASGVHDEESLHREAAVRLLLAAGAKVNFRDDGGGSALSRCHADAELVRILLAAGATGIDARDWHGRTPLMNSFDPDVTAVLLAAGADPYLKDKDGKTALEYASSWTRTGPVLERWMAEHPQK